MLCAPRGTTWVPLRGVEGDGYVFFGAGLGGLAKPPLGPPTVRRLPFVALGGQQVLSGDPDQLSPVLRFGSGSSAPERVRHGEPAPLAQPRHIWSMREMAALLDWE